MPTVIHNGQPIPYTLIRSARRQRTVSIRVDATGAVSVRAPLRLGQGAIARLTAARAAWIAARLQGLSRLPESPVTLPGAGLDGGMVFVAGQPHRVRYEPTPLLTRQGFCQRRDDGTLCIAVPAGAGDPDALAAAALVAWYRQQAATALAARTAVHAARLGLSPRRILISAARTRWGSCSHDNVIRYSWQLMTLPPDLVDYVVVHELCHIREKNHGPAFWTLVGTVLPDWRERRRRLRTMAGRYLVRDGSCG